MTLPPELEKMFDDFLEKMPKRVGELPRDVMLEFLLTVYQAGRRDVVGKIGAELLARHSPQIVLDAYFEVANEQLEQTHENNN